MISKLKFFIFILLVILVIIKIITAANPECNNKNNKFLCPRRQLTLRKAGAKYYYMGAHFKLNWYQALLFCRRHGMELATISSKAQSDNIDKLLVFLGFGKYKFWISGTDLGEEDKYHWIVNGELIKYKNWVLGQPDNKVHKGEVENCIELIGNVDGNHFLWNDATCSSLKYFICEL